MYQQVARYTPPQSVIDRINNLISYNYLPDIPHFNLQNLNNAFGPVVNSDFFPVKITNMPSGMNPENLTEYFRTHIDNFITGNTTFTPYVDHYTNDTQLFNQPGAVSLGALVHIDMISDGTVIESDYKNDYLNGIIDLATLKHRLGC